MDKINKNFETSEKENDESKIFDPVFELENIKQTTNHAERRQKIKEYKVKLTEQKERIATMQDLLINFIRQNPDVPLDELSQKLEKMGGNLNLADWQIEIGRKILIEYDRRHNLIKELKKQYPDEQELFYFLFGWKPEGKIEFSEEPITIVMGCHNFNDFARLFSTGGRYEAILEVKKEKKDELREIVGGYLFHMKDPYGGLAIVFNKAQWAHKEKTTIVHEEQHAIYSLFNKILTKKQYLPVLKKESPMDENLDQLKIYLHSYLLFCEEYAADEVLAYFRQINPERLGRLFEYLTKAEESGGIYDFCSKSERSALVESCCDEIKEKLELTPSEDLQSKIEKIVEEIFVVEYRRHLQEGIRAMALLKDLNFSDEETIAFLSTELLSQWPRTVNRLIEQRQLKGKLN